MESEKIRQGIGWADGGEQNGWEWTEACDGSQIRGKFQLTEKLLGALDVELAGPVFIFNPRENPRQLGLDAHSVAKVRYSSHYDNPIVWFGLYSFLLFLGLQFSTALFQIFRGSTFKKFELEKC